MDLIPEKVPSIKLRKRFRSLKIVNVPMEEPLPETPVGVDYGVLENGLTYYVRCNTKPRMRAALALAVKAGSVLEEENERGVAHIVEHLAFSATTYTDHNIVEFLESIGAQFGACQNAFTSCDTTVYELLVPVDKPELLSQAISILAEFSSEFRVSAHDVDKERGAILEEYRIGRNATGRIQDAHWSLLLEGSKYAERLPIGLEKVIKTVTPETIKCFYQKWYHLQNMAVVAVGDFNDTQTVVDLINTHFGKKLSKDETSIIPQFPIPTHDEPRFSCFVDSEAHGSIVLVSCKVPVEKMTTVKHYRNMLAEGMFHCALNQRFFKISRRNDPPYLSCSSSTDDLVKPVKAYIMSSHCKEKGTVQALESMLLEVARIRLYGFSEREISIARASMLSDVESAYLQRDQMQSTSHRSELLRHFFSQDPVMGIEYEAQLQKTILPNISAAEVSKLAEKFRTTCSSVIKIVEPQACATLEDLKAVVQNINNLERERSIPIWDDEHIPEEIVGNKPNPGSVVQRTEFSSIGVTEMLLSNGMKICYKCTDFHDDQILFTGFAYGGLSELSEKDYISCSLGSIIAGEVGIFGYKPSVLMDMLAGKRAEVETEIDQYMRLFSGYCSPSDLETGLQLVYQLFTTNVVPGDEEVKYVMQAAEEIIRAHERDPYDALVNRVTELTYGNSYFFRPIRTADLRMVDPIKACEYFNCCFKDPSAFTIVLVGKIDPGTILPLILQYLGGIPRPSEPVLHFDRDDLKSIPFALPAITVREEVHRPMVEAQCFVQLSFPAELKNKSLMEETHFVGFLSKLLETKMIQNLRFKHGKIYAVDVSVSFGSNKPSRSGDLRGDISLSFSCHPDVSWKLIDIALDEISHLQKVGPSDQDVSTILEIEQRAHENGLQENYYWLDRILDSYQSQAYTGDVGVTFQAQDEARDVVRGSLTPETIKLALQRIMSCPCKGQYTAVVLVPQKSWLKRLDTKILVGAASATMICFSLWRYFRHRNTSN